METDVLCTAVDLKHGTHQVAPRKGPMNENKSEMIVEECACMRNCWFIFFHFILIINLFFPEKTK